MNRAVFSPAAAQDLDEILAFVALDGESRAELVAARLRAGIERIAIRPLLGHNIASLDNSALRIWTVRPFLIVYRYKVQPVEIARILHGSRDLAAIFNTPE